MWGACFPSPPAPRGWRVALHGTDAALELNGYERMGFPRREGEGLVKAFPKTDIEHAEFAVFAAAITGGPAYPLPLWTSSQFDRTPGATVRA